MRRKTYRVRPSHIKRSMGERILFSIVFIIFTILALSYVFSFAWVFLNSLKDGFEFDGQVYKSLSAIALEITGRKISGKEFFGV